jgi:hypothetical protein
MMGVEVGAPVLGRFHRLGRRSPEQEYCRQWEAEQCFSVLDGPGERVGRVRPGPVARTNVRDADGHVVELRTYSDYPSPHGHP